jgi:hypothetical protein
MSRYKNVGSHPVELTGGQMVGIGEEVALDSEAEADEHNQIYIEEEVFLPLDIGGGKSVKSKTAKEE